MLQVIKETSRSCVKNCEKFVDIQFSMVVFHIILDCAPILWNKNLAGPVSRWLDKLVIKHCSVEQHFHGFQIFLSLDFFLSF